MREPANDYSASQYQRPNQPWVCGLSESGQTCPAGPTVRGRCPAMAECAPIRNGDRWECNRSQLRGGPCDVGPTPEGGCGRVRKCHPTRSLRTVRGRFVRVCAFLVAGLVLISLSANWRNRVIAPGPLARQHAQLMERHGEAANCAACHSAAEKNVGGWLVSLVVAQSERRSQPQLCMECHAKTISKDLALAAHNLSAEALSELNEGRIRLISAIEQETVETTAGNKEQTLPLPLPKRDGKTIACAACHREHHGAQVDLTATDNAACQSCHRQRYESFASDHPDFGIWPYERRTRIAFNHASHRDKHFAEKKQSFDCVNCHTEDATGKVELTASYEKACASCHNEKISTSIGRGVPMLALPTMDIAAMRSAGLELAAWPKRADGDFDGRLPPAMKLLLAADPSAAQAMTNLGPGFDFQDVNPKDRQQLAGCAALSRAINKLMSELSQSPEGTIRARLQATLGRPLTETDVANLASGLSADTLRVATEHWLGTKTQTDGAQALPTSTADKEAERQISARSMVLAPAGTWSRDETSFSIRYRPTAHADPVLVTWLNVLADKPDSSQRPIVAAMLKELAKSNAPGLCTSCHSIEAGADHKITINWHAADRAGEPRGFTKFAHRPHLLLPQLSNCAHCHMIDAKAGAAAVSSDLNPARFVSDFAPIAKQACATCHTAQAAGDECQKCHNYHIERVENWRGKDPATEDLRSARLGWSDSH